MSDLPPGNRRRTDASPASRIALKVSELHADLLSSLHEEIGTNGESFPQAAQRLAAEFGSVTAAAIDAAQPSTTAAPPVSAPDEPTELPSLYRPGHMRRRLDQLLETNRRYGHPFGLAVFDASGPGRPPRRRRRRSGDRPLGRRRRPARQHPHRRRSLPPRGGRDLRPRPQHRHGRRGADVRAAARASSTTSSGRGGCGSRSRPGWSPAPTTAPTPKSFCTRQTRRCGAHARWASPWAWAPCKIANSFCEICR